MLLDIEARIGELLPDAEEARRLSGAISKGKKRNGKREPVLPEGISGKRAHQSRVIARNPDIVEKVKAQARQNEIMDY